MQNTFKRFHFIEFLKLSEIHNELVIVHHFPTQLERFRIYHINHREK